MAAHQPTLFVLETWKPIPGHPNYEASNRGRVRSIPRTVTGKNNTPRRLPGHILKPWVNRSDRECVKLCTDKKNTNARVHQLVALAFIGECPEGMMVCHNNGDHHDNRPENLRYDTMRGNMHDAVRHGTHNMARKTHCKRGHLLAEPNLTATGLKRGWRECKACTSARNDSYSEDELQAISDQNYRAIMGGGNSAVA